jgi:hypothetical protein
MTDQEGPAPRVIISVPPGYWDLPEPERLALAEEMAAVLQDGPPPDGAGQPCRIPTT